MQPMRYDMPEAQTSLEFILEQVSYGTEVIIIRRGVEIARITAVKSPTGRVCIPMSVPYEQ